MPISVTCDACGKTLKAPDTAAGKKAKCPQCSAVVKIPEMVYDAEEIEDDVVSAEEAEDYEDYDSADDDDDNPYAEGASARSRGNKRRPCPSCGEMIVANAVKCRYCDEVFDSVAGKAIRSKTREKTNLDADDRALLKKYRGSMGGLGGFCVFALLVCGALIVFRSALPRRGAADVDVVAEMIIFGGLALAWLVLAIFCFQRKLWAAYLVGGLCGLNTIANIAQSNIGGGVFAGAVTWAAFAAAAQGRELKRRGISPG